ncbi:MAG: molybdopterin-synthase adenylyltransferase MoeB [Lentisphaeraceae bacterium]|nr:molybdopterin-synthase adenylyltransferase MoeB [Lentisphaeraceae bacterium]
MSLNNDELTHYSRHLLLSEIGKEGQEKLKNASVLIIGGGGLGCPAALYLAAAGVGKLGIIDFDQVDISNLQRQIAFSYSGVGKPKVTELADRLSGINPHVEVVPYQERFGIENAESLFNEYDLVIDGCDNFGTRYLSNDASFFTKTPLIFGAIHKFSGQMSVFSAEDDSPCYRCLFPEPPEADSIPNCAEAGVLGVLPGVVGTIQATEAIKVILSLGETLKGRFMTYDALSMRFSEFKLAKNSHCPLCGDKPSIKELSEAEILCASQKEESVEFSELSPKELSDRLKNPSDIFLIDVREEVEWEICKLPESNQIPLRMIPDLAKALPKDKDIILYCHHGLRSRQAISILRKAGVERLFNLSGGITQWAEEIDEDMPQY